MSAGQEITTIIAASVVVLVGVIATLIKIFGKPTTCPVNAGDALEHLAEAVREQTKVLSEIRDRIVGMSYEQNQIGASAGRVENSMSALHRRFDSITGPRE